MHRADCRPHRMHGVKMVDSPTFYERLHILEECERSGKGGLTPPNYLDAPVRESLRPCHCLFASLRSSRFLYQCVTRQGLGNELSLESPYFSDCISFLCSYNRNKEAL